jgi:hypothetical protein
VKSVPRLAILAVKSANRDRKDVLSAIQGLTSSSRLAKYFTPKAFVPMDIETMLDCHRLINTF